MRLRSYLWQLRAASTWGLNGWERGRFVGGGGGGVGGLPSRVPSCISGALGTSVYCSMSADIHLRSHNLCTKDK